MKGIALILALMIFTTSVKGSSLAKGLMSMAQGATSGMSCCKKSKGLEDVKQCEAPESENEEEKSGCCEGSDCDCACCLHIAYVQQFNHNSFTSNDFLDVKFDYSFLYQADYLASVFHPPAS